MNDRFPPQSEADDAAHRQIRAAAPDRSSWVAANAGSGKTRVLTDRVARLLLAGTEPQRILCLTYTKAAAAEMQSRLFHTLGRWAMLPDHDLTAELAALGAAPQALRPEALATARTLFARALETPGGLRIQTIHAFCESLLRRFPLEAGVAPGFSVLDDRAARSMREEVLDALALAEPDLIAAVAAQLSGDDPDPLLVEIGARRADFAGSLDPAALAAALGIDPAADAAADPAGLLDAPGRAALAEAARLGAASGSNDRKVADCIAEALAEPDPGRALDILDRGCLTQAGAPKAFLAKAIRTRHPQPAADFDRLAEAIAAARDRRLALVVLERSLVLNRFARAWLAALDARKAARALLDFDDMIDRSRRLLADPATAAFVLWKLDGGIDHILVDEAQDTSPAQWAVVQALSEEFFAGDGARDVHRTVFVVGDEKQSIYSFQGADPEAFGSMRRHFEERIAAMGEELQRCGLIHSFRSAQPVLCLVDAVFSGPAGAGLDNRVTHVANRPDLPGRVELWPFLPKPEKPDEGPWWRPVDAPLPGNPVVRLADAIADRLRGWLDGGRELPGTGRAIRPGDVMILVQRRGPVFDAVIRALKRARVPVAGADVLRLGGELAVKDLLAALRVTATPRDDLSLAALLRSPLGGLSEDELFLLAHGRPGSLLQALRNRPAADWPGVRGMLADLADRADYLRPFELLSRILLRHDGRRALVARLGPEAEDGIDALLDAALAYETAEPPTLGGFLDWIDHDEMQVKRRSDESADEVRVMTVHGAKGLEAEIVILPDTAGRGEGGSVPQILLAGGRPLWRPRAAEAPAAVTEAEAARKARSRAENMRLLYVALTRARRWLIVCGAGGEPKADGDAWHPIVAAAMDRIGAPTDAAGVQALSHAWSEAAAGSLPARPVDRMAIATAPGNGSPRLRPLSPSSLGGGHALPWVPPETPAETSDEAAAETEDEARRRGEALHLLLEHLHGLPPAARAAVAARVLPGAPDLGRRLAEAEAVLDAPAAAPVFGPGSLAEVDVAAALPELRGRVLLGRIDRLVVAPDRVLAVDFKSNRHVPADPWQVPEGILRQMGAYRAALARIWPGRAAAAAILWTRGPLLMPLPDALVDAALGRAGADLDPGRGGPYLSGKP